MAIKKTQNKNNGVTNIQDWSKLPITNLNTIASYLDGSLLDHLGFSAVCSTWRLAAAARRPNMVSKTPWLLFPITALEKTHTDYYRRPDKKPRYGLLNLSQQKQYVLDLHDDIRNTYFFVAAYKSWIMLMYEDGTSFLLNPFTSTKIMLPRESNIGILSVPKFVVSESGSGDFIIMVLHGTDRKLAYCKPGDKSWTAIKDYDLEDVIDIVWFRGRFYAVDELMGVFVITISDSASVEQIKPCKEKSDDRIGSILVGSSNEEHNKIMLVGRFGKKNQTEQFHVYELDAIKGGREWVSVKRLPENCALFVGGNMSMCVSLTDDELRKNSSLKCCTDNCIYFADSFEKFPVVFHGVAEYDMSDGGIRHLGHGQGVVDIGINFLQGHGVWITPSLS